ncbi:hypothetical protein [Capnocytophaga sp.]|uniref:hypothetical protein n=1 Tax=Capnocytophaga sp. TaxID=44737 RepID=UPI0026DD7403|nr:hypothetical protein [Capnocytophaga sp.]MDO5106493.1 hypothetical protein [Capnocytophaga sp.]
MEKQLKTFVTNTMPLPEHKADELIADFIRYNRNVAEYTHLFENENDTIQKVSDFLKDEGKILRPCSFYVYSDGLKNASIFVADEVGECRLVGNTDNILPSKKEKISAIAISKSAFRLENPPAYLGEITDFSVKGYFLGEGSFVKQNIVVSGYWAYSNDTKEITFPENPYIEVGKVYTLDVSFDWNEFPRQFLWLNDFVLNN